MKSNKFVEELKTKSDAELAQELVAAKKELFNLRFQNATNQLDVYKRQDLQCLSVSWAELICRSW